MICAGLWNLFKKNIVLGRNKFFTSKSFHMGTRGVGGADNHTTQNCFDIRVLPKGCEKCKMNFLFFSFYISYSPLFTRPNFFSLAVCTLDQYLMIFLHFSQPVFLTAQLCLTYCLYIRSIFKLLQRKKDCFPPIDSNDECPESPRLQEIRVNFWKKLWGWPPTPNMRGYLYHSLFRFYFENIEDWLPKFPKKIDHKNSFRLPHIAGNWDQFLRIFLGMTPKPPQCERISLSYLVENVMKMISECPTLQEMWVNFWNFVWVLCGGGPPNPPSGRDYPSHTLPIGGFAGYIPSLLTTFKFLNLVPPLKNPGSTF